MTRGRERWLLLLPEPVRETPADLAATIGQTLITIVTVLGPVVRETPLRVAFGLAFVLFLFGYAFIAALFPEAGEAPPARWVMPHVQGRPARAVIVSGGRMR